MKKIRSILALALLSALGIFSGCGTQQPATANAASDSSVHKSAPIPEKNPNEEPFDITAEPIAKSFIGHDIKELCESLEKRKASQPKGEFETTEQYKQRLSEEKTKPILGTLTTDSIFAFRVGDPTFRYDADHQMLTLALSPGYQVSFNSKSLEGSSTLKYNPLRQKVGSYKGTNGFGVSKEIAKIDEESRSIQIHNALNLPMRANFVDSSGMFRYYHFPEYAIELQMEPALAKETKENVRALLICNLVEPFSETKEDHTTPTISLPEDVTSKSFTVHVNLREVWFYNVKTMTVYGKIVSKPNVIQPVIVKKS